MSLFFGMKGAAYEPKELRMAYETKIKEQEAALKMECRGSHVPESTLRMRSGNCLRIKLFR